MKKLIIMLVLVITIMGTTSVIPVMAEDDDDIIFLYPEYNPLESTTNNEKIFTQSSSNTDIINTVIDDCIGGDEPWDNKIKVNKLR